MADVTSSTISSADLRLAVTADANITGWSTNPQITYTNNDTDIDDAAGNAISTFTIAATDSAPPVYLSSTTIDNNNDGTVDYIKVVYSEPILDSSVSAVDFQAGIADTTAWNLIESFTSGVPATWNVTDVANDNTIYIGVANGTETILPNKTDYTLKIQQVWAVTDSLTNSLASFVLKTSTDGSAPVVSALSISDANSDGYLDTATLTYSENLADTPVGANWFDVTSVSDHWTCNAESANPDGSNTLTLTFSCDTLNTAVGDLNIAFTANAGVKDSWNIQSHSKTFTSASSPLISDAAAPIPVSATTSKWLYNGNILNWTVITVNFSEPITVTPGSIDVVDNGDNNIGNDVSVLFKPDWSNADYVVAGLNNATARYSQGGSNQLRITANADTTVWSFLTSWKLNIGNGLGISDWTNNSIASSSDIAIAGLMWPVVDAISISNIGWTSANVSWITYASTTSNYITLGTDPEALSQLTTVSSPSINANDLWTSTTVHNGIISGLSVWTTYYYKVCSTLVSEGCSSINNFTTVNDIVAPVAPVITTSPATVNSDFYTIAGTVTADASSTQTIKVSNWSSIVGTVIVPKSGTSWSVVVALPQSTTTTFTATSTDEADNVSLGSNSVSIIESSTAGADITAPTAPVVTTAPATVNSDFYTIAGTVTADASSTQVVKVFAGTTPVGTVIVPKSWTSWSVVVNLPQSTTTIFKATSTDESWNVSLDSNTVSIIESSTAGADITAPTAPVVTTTPATVNSDFYTIAGTVTADASSTQVVKVFAGTTPVGTVIVPKSWTSWSVVVNLPQSTTTIFKATSTDESWNVSLDSNTVSIIESSTAGADITAPTAPVITTAPSTVNSDFYTIAGTVTADASSTQIVKVMVWSIAVGTVIVPKSWTVWSVVVNLPQSTTTTFKATSTDESGNVSLDSNTVSINESSTAGSDITAPTAPVITISPVTVNSDFYTIAGTVTADASSTQTLKVMIWSAVVGTVIVPKSWTVWSVVVALPQSTTTIFKATSTDESWNVSLDSNTVSIIESSTAGADITAPIAPVITTSPTSVNSDFYTIAGTVTADASSTQVINIFAGTNPVGTVIVPKSGTSWSIVVSLPQSTTTIFKATSTDESWNVSLDSNTVSIIEWDTTPPSFVSATPSNAATSVSSSAWSATVTFNKNLTIADQSKIKFIKVSDSSSSINGIATVSTNALTINYNALSYNTSYEILVQAGALSDGTNLTTVDTSIYFTTQSASAPDITKLRSLNITSTGFSIDWTTDIVPDTQQYRIWSYAYGSDVKDWTTLASATHSIWLDSVTLSANSIYYYQVKFVKNWQTTYSNPIAITTSRWTDWLYVDEISVIKSTASYDAINPYTNWWHFRMKVATDDATKNNLQMSLDNLVSGTNTLSSSWNTMILVSSNGTNNASESAITWSWTNVSTIYSTWSTVDISSIDNNPSLWGRQFYIDIYIKIPNGQTPWSYSTSYAVRNISRE